jgi:hypothetical protein
MDILTGHHRFGWIITCHFCRRILPDDVQRIPSRKTMSNKKRIIVIGGSAVSMHGHIPEKNSYFTVAGPGVFHIGFKILFQKNRQKLYYILFLYFR